MMNHTVTTFMFLYTREKKFSEKTSFQVRARPVKGQKQGRDEKTQEHYHTIELWWPSLWPPTQCTCIPSSLCMQLGEP